METPELIDWTSGESHLLLNPRLPERDRAQFLSLSEVHPIDAHIWIATSGSSGRPRLVALSKDAFLRSAEAVNAYAQSTSRDLWLAVLPPFHVGGLAIFARAFLSGAHVRRELWSRERLPDWNDVTLASLVPAQLYDLVEMGRQPPSSLRMVFIGGGILTGALATASRDLGWPVVATYGMTETASMVATSNDRGPLSLLEHVEARASAEGYLEFRGPSLLTGYAFSDPAGPHFVDPKRQGWFTSEDLGVVSGRLVEVIGRKGDVVKIGGESVSLARLDAILGDIMREVGYSGDAALAFAEDARLGVVVALLATAPADELIRAYGRRVLPFEAIRSVRMVGSIPRTSLGKVIRSTI